MNDILRINVGENLQVVIQIATKYSDILGPIMLIETFESFNSFELDAYASPNYKFERGSDLSVESNEASEINLPFTCES